MEFGFSFLESLIEIYTEKGSGGFWRFVNVEKLSWELWGSCACSGDLAG